MAEYIEREKVIAEIDNGDLLVGDNAKWAKEILCRTPTADVVEVDVPFTHAQVFCNFLALFAVLQHPYDRLAEVVLPF